MSVEDIMKITAAAASAPLTALLIKYLSDRKAQREQTRQEQLRGDSTLQVAALGSYKEIIESYRRREEALMAENKALREEVRQLHHLFDEYSRTPKKPK